MPHTGVEDVRAMRQWLAARLPSSIAGLATLAMNYRWAWTGGADLFSAVEPHRWETAAGNPVRLLLDASPSALARAAGDPAFVERVAAASAELEAHLAGGPDPAATSPVAFICAEFGIHSSLPIYSGGLGVLAGDVLKEAGDRGVPLVGVGLLYRQGYFRQRVDRDGWQQEWWSQLDPDRLPMALVTGDDGEPITIAVEIRGRQVVAQIWRVDIGRVPLFLLDAERSENRREDRWITSRLYIADRRTRLAQYALLGEGGVLALRALGIEPAVVHLNEGHAALAPIAMARQLLDGDGGESALDRARGRTVFTTHTPVAAGNETIDAAAAAELVTTLARGLGLSTERVLGLGRSPDADAGAPFGLTPLGVRMSRSTNAVSRRHGVVAREMWRPLFGGEATVDAVPISAVTNGVHLPTWMAPAMAALLDAHLPTGWRARAADPGIWSGLDSIPDVELWRLRCRLRGELVAWARDRGVRDRLSRGEPVDDVEPRAAAVRDDVLTLGFARRLATYKRMSLLARDPERLLRLLGGERPVQILLAGKAHPSDDGGKAQLQELFRLSQGAGAGDRIVVIEDYDIAVARQLVSGCDVWLNVPRFPLEACGTSGMKAAMNGALNLSVCDGWWEEAFDGGNGWGIGGRASTADADPDEADAEDLFRLLEDEVIPLFNDRGADGVPHGWVARVRASMRGIIPRYCATRMIEEYRERIWNLSGVDSPARL